MLLRRREPPARWVLALLLSCGALCIGVGVAAQDAMAIAPGDARVDGLRIRAFTHRYYMYQVFDTGTAPERVGQLTERVQLAVVGRDTVIIQTRGTVMHAADTSVDSLTLNRRTLAPLAQRETWNSQSPHRGWLRRGTDFHGDTASHFGTIPEESFDRKFTRKAFFEGTEILLLLALQPQFVRAGASFTVATWSYGRTLRPLLEQSKALVHVRGSARFPVQAHGRDVWVSRFGESTYWVAKDSLEVVQWEEYPEEAGFSYRFVRESP